MKRHILIILVVVSVVGLAGCTNKVATDEVEENTVVRSDAGIAVVNLTVSSEGNRDCYHDYEATVVNNNSQSVEDVRLTIAILNKHGQVLSEFTTGYARLTANESTPLTVSNGPQKQACWDSGFATNYTVNVTYTTT